MLLHQRMNVDYDSSESKQILQTITQKDIELIDDITSC